MKLSPCRKEPLDLNHPRSVGGFTLVEMLLVLVILGVLAGIVYPNLAKQAERARIKATIAQIAQLRTALASFEMENGHFPNARGGLQDLVKRPSDAPSWNGPYLDPPFVPKDAWHNEFLYECPGRNNPSSYDLSSAGPDGILGTEDDITSWLPNN